MKATTVLSGVPGRYGAEELKSGYQRFLLRALILSSFIHFVFWGTYGIKSGLFLDDPGKPKLKRPVHEGAFYIPPSVLVPVTIFSAVRAVGGSGGSRAGRGIPVPVPVVVAEEWNLDPVPADPNARDGAGVGGGSEGGVADAFPIEPPPEKFVPFEKEPMAVLRVEPEYPEICRQAGLSGSVTARLWITRHGKVRDVVIVKSDSELFNQAVMDAAKQWIFTPALMNKGPVAVWWSVVFSFKLK